jgi:hypothetical protein
VRRRVFGNENELAFVICVEELSPNELAQDAAGIVIHGAVQKKSSTEQPAEDFSQEKF